MSCRDPNCEMIPALHVCEPSAAEAATEARFRDLTSGEPMEANEIIWFGWVGGDRSPVLVRLDDLAIAIEPASGAARVVDAVAQGDCDNRIDQDWHGFVAVPVIDQQVGPVLAGADHKGNDVNPGDKTGLRAGDRLLE